MLHARTWVTLATSATLAALLMLAGIAKPVVGDSVDPTPLPDAHSGPLVNVLLATAQAHGLICEMFAAPPVGEKWSCNREVTPGVYYITDFAATDPLVLQAYLSGDFPWPEDHDQFLLDMAAQFCLPASYDLIAEFIPKARTGSVGLYFEDEACLLYSDYRTDSFPFHHLIAWAKIDPGALATAAPTFGPTPIPTLPPPPPTLAPTSAPTAGPSPTPAATAAPVGGNGGDGSANGPTGFVRSIPAPSQVSSEPLVIAESLALAGLIVLLMPFPAQLFNSTLETHYATVRRWFRLDNLQRAAGRVSGFWDSLVGILLFVVLSALIYALLDPGVGLDARSAATIVGLAIGIVVTTVMASAPSLVDALRNHGKWRLRALPATLIVGLACVLISRLTGFLPGYLYGVILGFVFARELTRAEQGRANGLAAALLLAIALVAWLALALIGPNPSGIVATLAATTLSTLLVAGLEAVVFGLLPFRFLPGEPLHATNRLLWAALLLVGAFCFFHILINPASGYLASSSRTPLLTIVALFVAFALLSIAFWAYFRNKPIEAAPSEPQA